MPTVCDLAVDVGLGLRTEDYKNFIEDVSDILKYGYSEKIDNAWIVSLCERSSLRIAADVLSACGQSRPKWWEVYYNAKVKSPNIRLPKGRRLQEMRLKKAVLEQKKTRQLDNPRDYSSPVPRRKMKLEFATKGRNRRLHHNYPPTRHNASPTDVPQWPGRSPSPRRSPSRSRSPSPRRSHRQGRNRKRRRYS